MMFRIEKITIVIVIGATLFLARPVQAVETVIQYEGDVLVGNDGNGVTTEVFATTLDGAKTHYALLLENGCKLGTPKCKFPLVSAITVTLNDDVVLQEDASDTRETVEVALNPVGSQPNSVIITARGTPGARARVHIVAIEPGPRRMEGLSVLPAADLLTFIVIHNAGPSPIAYRIIFYLPDGTEAGRTSAHRVEAHGSELRDLSVAAQGMNWNVGAVHVLWGSLGQTIVSATASYSVEINGQTVSIRGLDMDDLATFPVNKTRFDEDSGGLLE
ncbi:MAG TPA: hypothetical protein VH815_05910 [Acidobacteriota bacterium]